MRTALFLLLIAIGMNSNTNSLTNPTPTFAGPRQQCAPGAVLSGDLGYTGTECHGCSMTGKHIEGEPDIEFASEPVLSGITKGGPADHKLAEGDVLVAINGESITSRAGATQLSWVKPGESVRLTVRRNGAELNLEIVAGERCRRVNSKTQPMFADMMAFTRARMSRSENRGWAGLGVQVRASSGDLPEVIYVAPESPAAKAGIKSGDQIVAVDGLPLETPSGAKSFRDLKPDQQMTLTLKRDGEQFLVNLTSGKRP